MKTVLHFALPLFFLIAACQNRPSGNQRVVVQGEKPVKEIRKELAYTDTLSSEKAVMLIAHYMNIKDALVNSDAERSAHMAKMMLPLLEQNEDTILKIIYTSTKAISLTKNLDKQRTYFYPLSEAVYAVMKTSKSWPSLLYKQYCPMAFDDTGAWWLSEEEEIMNPYFGDEMLHCGMVQEKL